MSRELNRRKFLVQGTAGLGTSVLGLSWLDQLMIQEVRGQALADTREYDAAMMIYYEGGPSQADTFDVNPKSAGNRYPTTTIRGLSDIYDQPVHVSNLVENLCSISGPERIEGQGKIGIGLIRSMHHGIPVHQFAQKFTTSFWQSPVGFRYPPAAPVMAHYFDGFAAESGLPGSVFIHGETGRDANAMRGAKVPMALNVFGNPAGMRLMPSLLTQSAGVDYRKRREIIETFSRTYDLEHPDSEVIGWASALDQAIDLTLKGVAADAFRVDESALLARGNADIHESVKHRFTLAQQLIKHGVPFVNVGLGGNDEGHFDNNSAVERIFGQITDNLIREMILGLEDWCVSENKRVLILMAGEFGRTPHKMGVNAKGRDTREHWASGFTWALVSINHPGFKSVAVGDTGPDGSYTLADGNLVDPVRPSAVGGLLYTAMGFPPTDPRFHVDTIDGRRPPVDLDFVRPLSPDGIAEGNTPWLMKQFGLGVPL